MTRYRRIEQEIIILPTFHADTIFVSTCNRWVKERTDIRLRRRVPQVVSAKALIRGRVAAKITLVPKVHVATDGHAGDRSG